MSNDNENKNHLRLSGMVAGMASGESRPPYAPVKTKQPFFFRSNQSNLAILYQLRLALTPGCIGGSRAWVAGFSPGERTFSQPRCQTGIV